MSLRTFHIIFVTSAILLSISFGVWCMNFRPVDAGTSYKNLGIASLVMGIALAIYELRFIRFSKKI